MIFEYCILEFSICDLLPHSMLRIILMVSQPSQAKTHWSYPVRWTCLDCSEHWLSVDSISVQCRFFDVFLTLFGKDYSILFNGKGLMVLVLLGRCRWCGTSVGISNLVPVSFAQTCLWAKGPGSSPPLSPIWPASTTRCRGSLLLDETMTRKDQCKLFFPIESWRSNSMAFILVREVVQTVKSTQKKQFWIGRAARATAWICWFLGLGRLFVTDFGHSVLVPHGHCGLGLGHRGSSSRGWPWRLVLKAMVTWDSSFYRK